MFQTVIFSEKNLQKESLKKLLCCITRTVFSVLKSKANFCGLYTPFYGNIPLHNRILYILFFSGKKRKLITDTTQPKITSFTKVKKKIDFSIVDKFPEKNTNSIKSDKANGKDKIKACETSEPDPEVICIN